MQIYHTTRPDEAVFISQECLAGSEGVIVCVNDEPCVFTGALPTINRYACEQHNLPIGEFIYFGGTIVCMPGDLSICITTWGDSELAPQIVDRAAEWLTERGIAISRDENDVLADGKKVISWARARTIQGWCQSVVHFSVGEMDLDLVQSICTKPMVKVPGALCEYGVTAEDLWTVIEPLIMQSDSQEETV